MESEESVDPWLYTDNSYRQAWSEYVRKTYFLGRDLSKTEFRAELSKYSEKDKLVIACSKYYEDQVIAEMHFEATNNPIFVWESIQCSLANNTDILDWTYKYLKEVSENLLGISGQQKIPSKIQSALKLKKGRGTFFDEWKKTKNDYLRIAVLVNALIKNGNSIRHASEYVSKISYLKNSVKLTKDNCQKYMLTGEVLPDRKYFNYFPSSLEPLGKTKIEEIYKSYKNAGRDFPEDLDW